MSGSSNSGRRHPPKEYRWRKGKSGNPDGARRRRPEGTVAIIDRLLFRPVRVSLNGEPRKVTALEAIVLQLLLKARSGSVRAIRILVKYQQFANQRLGTTLELTFVENEYTEALRKMGGKDAG